MDIKNSKEHIDETVAPEVTSEETSTNRPKVPFAVSEAYKSIRTNLMFLLTKKTGNIITISGSSISEGKSTTSINVAIAFSQLGNKVLLIDADMRRSSINKKLKLANETGLSNVLAGLTDFDSAVNHVNDSLDVLTAGQTAPNPSELLGSVRFKALIDDLSPKYSFILLDTPPITIVSDALIVAPHTDGVLLVVRDNFTMNDALRQSIASMKFANVKILGAILNAVDTKSKKHYGYKKHYRLSDYYKYGYEYGYGKYAPERPKSNSGK